MKRFWVITCLLLSLFVTAPLAQARFGYEIGEQTELLRVDLNGQILLQKEFTFSVLSSSDENGTDIWVGLPTDSTRVTQAEFWDNGQWTPVKHTTHSDDSEYYVSFTRFTPIRPGETGRFRFTANIPDLVYWTDRSQLKLPEEQQIVSISYIPAWWDNAEVRKLTVMMDFPGTLNPGRLRYEHTKPEITTSPDGDTRLIWSYRNLPVNAKKLHAVHVPRTYFGAGAAIKQDWMPLWVGILLIVAVGGGIGLAVWGITYSVKNRRYYQTPLAYMQGSKAYTSFDPVEAAIFFKVSPNLLVQLIIMGLVKKNVIKLTGENTMKRVPTLEALTWYENLFLDSINEQVELIPERWNENYKLLIDRFAELVQGYCGRQTMNYYTNFIKKTTFDEADDPRWVVLQQQLATGIFDQQDHETIRRAMPYHLNPYFPLLYMTLITPDMRRENDKYYGHIFPGARGGSSGGGGNSCACACACACASSGGCT